MPGGVFKPFSEFQRQLGCINAMRSRGLSADSSLDFDFEWDDDDFDARAADDDDDEEEGDYSDDELPDPDADADADAAHAGGGDLLADLNSLVARARSHRDRFLTDQINRWVRKVSALCF